MSETSSKILNDNTINALTKTHLARSSHYGLVCILTLIDNRVPTRTHVQIVVRTLKDNRYLAEVNFTIESNYIYFSHFNSKYENKGNGRIALNYFCNALNIIKNSISTASISYISGTLSSHDYSRWDKLIHMYSSFIPRSSMIIDGKYTPAEFISIMHIYSQRNVKFRIFLE